MRRRLYIVAAFILAVLATIAGWSQSLIYKDPPPGPLAFWFPLVVLTGATDLTMVALSFVQFPLVAIAFTFGIRRWPVARVLVLLALTHGLLAAISLSIVRPR